MQDDDSPDDSDGEAMKWGADQSRLVDALRPFGWNVDDDVEFWRRYYTDSWVFNLVNAVLRYADDITALRNTDPVSDDRIYSNQRAWDPGDGQWYTLTWKAVAKQQNERIHMLEKWATICSDLDRCEHGRHEGDVCGGSNGCNGPSHGNLLIGHAPIGHGLSREHILSPLRSQRTDPDAWRLHGPCNADGRCPIGPAFNRPTEST